MALGAVRRRAAGHRQASTSAKRWAAAERFGRGRQADQVTVIRAISGAVVELSSPADGGQPGTASRWSSGGSLDEWGFAQRGAGDRSHPLHLNRWWQRPA